MIALRQPLLITVLLGGAAAAWLLVVRPSAPAGVLVVNAPPPTPVPAAAVPSMFGGCDFLDLDGDGMPEELVEVPDTRGTGGATFDVMLDGRSVGRINGHCPFYGENVRGTLPDIIAPWRGGAVEEDFTRYSFVSGAYIEVSTRSCVRNICGAELPPRP